jgi:hypothetical protein
MFRTPTPRRLGYAREAVHRPAVAAASLHIYSFYNDADRRGGRELFADRMAQRGCHLRKLASPSGLSVRRWRNAIARVTRLLFLLLRRYGRTTQQPATESRRCTREHLYCGQKFGIFA